MGASEASRRKSKEGRPVTKTAAIVPPALSQSSLMWRGFLYLGIAVFGCAADLISKQLVFAWRGLPQQASEWWIIEGFFGIQTSLNRGAVFGMWAGFSGLFAILAVLAVGGILCWLFAYRAAEDLFLTVILAMITGGILGNLYDRLGIWSRDGLPTELESCRYAVRDWILFRYKQYTWPNFNIADCLLVVGAGLMMLHSFRMGAGDKTADSEAASKVEPKPSKS